jgi:flagellar hook-associated protein 1 FlgK
MADSAQAAGEAVMQSLEQRQAAVAGVNVDEELVDLVAYEQAFAAAAQYISVVNQLNEELLSIL